MMKKKIERIRLDGAKLGVDFVVVSKFAYELEYDQDFEMLLPGDFFPYEEGVEESENTVIVETCFQKELIQYVYDIGQDVDFPLAVTLGLGVIQSLHDGSLAIYHADTTDYPLRMTDEMLRLGMYYQITHPEYDDRHLDYLLQTKGGKYYLRRLFFCERYKQDPLEELKKIFANKKGNANNVVSIKSKYVK